MVKMTEEEFLKYVESLTTGLTTSNLAKIYNFTVIKFNKILQTYKIQYKRKYNGKDKWVLSKDLQHKGLQEIKYSSYVKANGDVLTFKTQPKWTKKGICYIYYYLKEHGIEPTEIETKYTRIEKKVEQLSFI